jgi:hypothetical protein
MSILSWNYWRLGQPPTIQELVCLVRKVCPKIVFISETRQHRDRVRNIGARIGMNTCFVVDERGKGVVLPYIGMNQ